MVAFCRFCRAPLEVADEELALMEKAKAEGYFWSCPPCQQRLHLANLRGGMNEI